MTIIQKTQTSIELSMYFEKSILLHNTISYSREEYSRTELSLGISYLKSKQNQLQFDLKLSEIKRKTLNTNQIDNQINLKFNASYLYEILSKHFLLIENESKNPSSKQYYTNGLFRFGGINSIRRFRENQLTPNNYYLLCTEYRFTPSSTIYFHTVTDVVYLENKIESTPNYLYSFGLGTGILTKAEILNLSLANGFKPSQSFKF